MIRKSYILIFVSVLSITGIVFTQKKLTVLTGSSWSKESMTYLPGQDRIKGALLGFESTVSHYLWIRTILYFGDHYLSDRNFEWLIQMVDVITRLNPAFYPAYEFAGLMIPDLCGSPDAARVILERGLFHLGDKKWNIAFYLGMIYYKYYNDTKSAADYYALASRVPGENSHKLAGLAASFYREAGMDELGRNLLLFMYETSESPDAKKYLMDKINDEVKNISQESIL
ncbi:MAG: hypothetical protein GX556_17150 [Fibrobacter sp.]|nr:hypothetical protein [Fibrobacter sp.]